MGQINSALLLETLIKINPSQSQPGWEKMQDKKQLNNKNSSSSFECCESLTLPNNLHIFSMLIHAQSSPFLIPASHLVLLFLCLQESFGGPEDAQSFVWSTHSQLFSLFAKTHLDREGMPRICSLNLISANAPFLAIFIFTRLL